ncbi:MAG: hypothetical protein K9G47_11975 [Bacteroidales bacterium]|nr:hypothetical protein [Bacteroidales bacterium]MCF8388589.1 hypothetical protein [Bacteroidales bacterium]
MTKSDLKLRITKAIDNAPESVLLEVLEYLNKANETTLEKIQLTKRLGKILREDRELLQKLAQ